MSAIFILALNIVVLSIQKRADLVVGNFPLVVSVICAAVRSFSQPISNIRQERQSGVQGIGDESLSLSPMEATKLSRLLVTLSNARLPRSESDLVSKKSLTVAASLAKHAPSILVAFVRCTADPRRTISVDIRRQLEPGLHALCDVITSGGRVGAHGREGEGIGLPYGLGDGPGREAEREIWADLWRKWSRKRYVGQG